MISGQISLGEIKGPRFLPFRADVPAIHRKPARASSSLEKTSAFSKISLAEVAIILASGERGSWAGETRINLDRPIFLMARLTEPMFPAN
jgi:hypothetical protein